MHHCSRLPPSAAVYAARVGIVALLIALAEVAFSALWLMILWRL